MTTSPPVREGARVAVAVAYGDGGDPRVLRSRPGAAVAHARSPAQGLEVGHAGHKAHNGLDADGLERRWLVAVEEEAGPHHVKARLGEVDEAGRVREVDELGPPPLGLEEGEHFVEAAELLPREGEVGIGCGEVREEADDLYAGQRGDFVDEGLGRIPVHADALHASIHLEVDAGGLACGARRRGDGPRLFHGGKGYVEAIFYEARYLGRCHRAEDEDGSRDAIIPEEYAFFEKGHAEIASASVQKLARDGEYPVAVGVGLHYGHDLYARPRQCPRFIEVAPEGSKPDLGARWPICIDWKNRFHKLV